MPLTPLKLSTTAALDVGHLGLNELPLVLI
jgi:hypothetical protein